MANCSNCSAPLPPDSIVCNYCKTRSDTDLKGLHHFTTHSLDSGRTCPHCNILMKTIDLKVKGTFLIERCDQCLGLFFDPQELEALLEATVSNVFEINRARLDGVATLSQRADMPVVYVKCPVCSKLMNRVNFGAKSGVIVDRCRDHGVWLDGGELRQLFEWVKAGGQLLVKEREEQRRHEEQREKERLARQAASSPPAGSSGEYTVFNDYGSVLRQSDPDLFDVVFRAARWFARQL